MSGISFAKALEPLGFSANLSGGHLARSMMLAELFALQKGFPPEAEREIFQAAIEQDNVLGKPTLSSRQKSFRHLTELYGLDPRFALFRNLRKIGLADESSFPLAAATCVFCRDPQLRASFELVAAKKAGETISRAEMEAHLEAAFPGRFSDAMKKSLSQNVNTTWTACGHLNGRSKKVRSVPKAGFGAVCYAMLAGWLSGLRGEYLLTSPFAQLVAADPGSVISALRDGAAHGWLRLRSGGGVTEIDFSPLLNNSEEALVHGTH